MNPDPDEVVERAVPSVNVLIRPEVLGASRPVLGKRAPQDKLLALVGDNDRNEYKEVGNTFVPN